jgi:hypothetical protein
MQARFGDAVHGGGTQDPPEPDKFGVIYGRSEESAPVIAANQVACMRR